MTVQTIRHPNLLPPALLQGENLSSVTNGEGARKAEAIHQSVYIIADQLKNSLTVKLLLSKQLVNVLIYVRTNHEADSLAESLNRSGVVAESVHANKSQRTKVRTLTNFNNRSTNVIVATESAASIIDVEVAMIINYELPLSAETYSKRIHCVHRGNMLKEIISFCDDRDQGRLLNIKRAFPGEIEVVAHDIA